MHAVGEHRRNQLYIKDVSPGDGYASNQFHPPISNVYGNRQHGEVSRHGVQGIQSLDWGERGGNTTWISNSREQFGCYLRRQAQIDLTGPSLL